MRWRSHPNCKRSRGLIPASGYYEWKVRQAANGSRLHDRSTQKQARRRRSATDTFSGVTNATTGRNRLAGGRPVSERFCEDSWATDRPGGFNDPDLRLFEEVLPTYSTIVEVKSLRRFATNVLSTYVGCEPGELIIKGQIRRGDVRTIKAALMVVDLRDFTSLSDALPPSEVLEALNRYFDCIIPPIKRHGGEVLEFLGDGILAILNENGERPERGLPIGI
jgi:hypothetical protein